MEYKTLLEKIKEYYRKTGYVGYYTDSDREIFDEVFKPGTFSRAPILESDLSCFLKQVKIGEIRQSLEAYKAIATDNEIPWVSDLSNVDAISDYKTVEPTDAIEVGSEIEGVAVEDKSTDSTLDNNVINIHIDMGQNRCAYGVYHIGINKVTVLKGSKVKPYREVSYGRIEKLRREYRKYIENNEIKYDIENMSLAASAVLILCSSVDGWKYWRTENGTLMSVLRDTGKLDSSIDTQDAAEDYSDDVTDSRETQNYLEETSVMTYEEMLFKGIQGLMSTNKQITVDLSDSTLSKLQNKPNPDPEFVWTTPDTDYTPADLVGYSTDEIVKSLKIKRALLLTGVPGTGKTRILNSLLKTLTANNKDLYELISFSQNTDYTDFIGGLVCNQGTWEYKDGVLVELCKKANKNPNEAYYIGIDEMSRGNTEAIFGELMTGIEHRDTLITLKNGIKLVVPSNLYIIGTMNILDNSTKKLDTATLERFTIVELTPQWGKSYINWLTSSQTTVDTVKNVLENISSHMIDINQIISNGTLLGKDKVIGTRSISNIELTQNNIKQALSGLILEIKERVKNCDEGRLEIEKLISSIEAEAGRL